MVQLYLVCINIQGAAEGGGGGGAGADTSPPEPEEERPEVSVFLKYVFSPIGLYRFNLLL